MKGGMIMNGDFWQSFLMISDIYTVGFLILLCIFFGIIHYLYRKRKMDFSLVVLIGMGLGCILGIFMQYMAGFPNDPMQVTFIKETTNWLQLFGNGYIDLIKMIVVPLVIVSIAHVIVNMKSEQKMSRLVKKTILVTMSMVAVASIVGIAFGIFFNVGGDVLTNVATEVKAKEIVSVATTLRGLIPGNLVDAMVKNNIIGMVIFGAFLGRAIWWIKADEPKVEEFMRKLVNGLHKALMNMALLILDYMPWAVIALLANTIAQKGLDSILSVVHFIFVLYLAIIAQFIIQLIALSINGINPIVYMKKSLALLILAFTSRSSVGCLPVTIETLTQKLGVNQATASFVAGFGTTAGMQGCAGIFPSLLIVYVCHLTGTAMDFSMIVMTIIVVTLGSLGIAGIPGTATMAASVGLSGVGMASSFSLIGTACYNLSASSRHISSGEYGKTTLFGTAEQTFGCLQQRTDIINRDIRSFGLRLHVDRHLFPFGNVIVHRQVKSPDGSILSAKRRGFHQVDLPEIRIVLLTTILRYNPFGYCIEVFHVNCAD